MSQLQADITHSRARFSACGCYRYTLWRVWDASRPSIAFVGLNPSTADAEQDDPTVRRCIGYARRWKYGGMVMLNVFALRSTDPRGLLAVDDPIGPENDAWMLRSLRRVELAVACWGNHGELLGRGDQVARALGPFKCLGLTKVGHPRHPLYLKGSLKLKAFSLRAERSTG